MTGLVAAVAHVGHLLVDLPIFLGPVLLILVALAVHTAWMRRVPRRPRADAPSPTPPKEVP